MQPQCTTRSSQKVGAWLQSSVGIEKDDEANDTGQEQEAASASRNLDQPAALTNHCATSLISLGMGHMRNSPPSPNIHLQAAFAATRPKTTQSRRELPPRRLFPWTPPATSPAAYRPGITFSFLS